MNCKQIQKLIQDALARDISPAAQEQLTQHLDTCDKCAKEYRELLRTVETTALYTPTPVSTTDWQDFNRNIRNAVAEQPAQKAQRQWKKQLVPALSLALIALTITLFSLKTPPPTPAPVTEPVIAAEETIDTAEIQELLIAELGIEDIYATTNEYTELSSELEEINLML